MKEQYENNLKELVQLMSDLYKIIKDYEEKAAPMVLTVEETAQRLQVSIPTFRRYILTRPDFPKIKLGTTYRIPYRALISWLDQSSTAK